MSAPPPSSDPSPGTRYHTSPQNLCRTRCTCTLPVPDIATPQEMQARQLGRVCDVWQQAALFDVPPEVHDAAKRVCGEIRASGWEFAHLVARQMATPAGSKVGEIGLLWLVPSPDDKTGHRILAEVTVQLYEAGNRKGKVRSLATRFANDWGDWTASHPDNYYRESGSEM